MNFSNGMNPTYRTLLSSGGPDFFIALAQHPEWGNGHTVWAEVVGDDMAVVDAIMRRPLRVANWGSINATELVTPLPYKLLAPEDLRRDDVRKRWLHGGQAQQS